ncbi:pgsA: CDP-diacylglycerol--glycerol-3-phosphate 3-phosphatidyltransferase [Rubrobacter radiotolerans]|uniref:CDP-diacylglycerol--glycerol-3-phosphate 3-phosphatidyltransferase n=1 Tax=Rubrobacter radiotolerans TaxID=42256 RepID=A0A023X379_RUBRA|nr:CDP-diacylglycerol--glycerol-3-phosphate 3-phosphatidyltransferase [Rubrobacter radiotolerans]AHY46465.1 pgsA: CDP-diacylglycerol--glycerol-3-phosphate 3-phosphatidyltransferase [Rubrobacter radiotolerans]MDX5893872.1 CDP-diacylglycerol--glycerol-3-phosphate 3-phosphatidyltransferase [Rubrobacter radiotolerans]SMC04668.1 CDP-diacylglycerol--glycerol-3-phosphate 3-phosphatidyltransferase [Rubrobacter radiotolerans DSM 5868]
MNLANQLTLARIVAIVPLMIALYVPFPGHYWTVLVIYVLALLTDYLDGVFARRQGKVTGFGKLMDSIADKALIVSVFFALVELGLMASWMAAIMVIREFAVTGLRMVALESGEVIAANSWGKAKMNAQSVAVFVLLLSLTGWLAPGFFAGLGWWLMVVAVVLTLISGWSYLKDTPRILSVQSRRDQRL